MWFKCEGFIEVVYLEIIYGGSRYWIWLVIPVVISFAICSYIKSYSIVIHKGFIVFITIKCSWLFINELMWLLEINVVCNHLSWVEIDIQLYSLNRSHIHLYITKKERKKKKYRHKVNKF